MSSTKECLTGTDAAGRTSAGEQEVPQQVAAAAPGRDALGRYAQQQWEALMLFLVGTSDRPPAPSPLLKAPRLAVESILTGAGLMTGTKSAQICVWLVSNKHDALLHSLMKAATMQRSVRSQRRASASCCRTRTASSGASCASTSPARSSAPVSGPLPCK